tara:strand:+ start:507 stop:686 length:180 start_codon:yes stop_codon:yes gene_type:complete
MIIWTKIPKIDLAFEAIISLEIAGFIGNKYNHFYDFAYMSIVAFFFILITSLDAVKNKK